MSKVMLTSTNFHNKKSVYVSSVCVQILCKTIFLRSIYAQKNFNKDHCFIIVYDNYLRDLLSINLFITTSVECHG